MTGGVCDGGVKTRADGNEERVRPKHKGGGGEIETMGGHVYSRVLSADRGPVWRRVEEWWTSVARDNGIGDSQGRVRKKGCLC